MLREVEEIYDKAVADEASGLKIHLTISRGVLKVDYEEEYYKKT